MANKPNWIEWGSKAVFVLVLAYVAAYYLMVVPYPRSHLNGGGPFHYYSIGSRQLPDAAHEFFRPVHRIDRQIRRDTWWAREDE
jgi:hypothetical protein